MTLNKNWLWIDDERNPPEHWPNPAWIARDSCCARQAVLDLYIDEGRFYDHISFDHDLGDDDTTMVFLKWYQEEFPQAIEHFTWDIHSENPAGKANIAAFLNSWKKSR